MSSNANISPAVARSLMREIKQLSTSPPDGIKLSVSEDCITNIQAEIEGPVGTPFEGGLFKCKLVLGQDFPHAPPKAFFLTKIFHPNVSKTGEICVNTLKKDWKSTHGIGHVLMVIRCLLIVPNPESALNEDAGKLLLERYEDYAERARLMTSIHAKNPAAKGAGAGSKQSGGVDKGDRDRDRDESKLDDSASPVPSALTNPATPTAAATAASASAMTSLQQLQPLSVGPVLAARSLSALPLSMLAVSSAGSAGPSVGSGSGTTDKLSASSGASTVATTHTSTGKAAPAMPSAPSTAHAALPLSSAPPLTRNVSAVVPSSTGVKKPAAPVKKAVKRL